MKKGEIAISVVIIVALGLLVLITLAVLLTGQAGQASTVVNECEATYGGSCTDRYSCLDGGGRILGTLACDGATSITFDNDWGIDRFPRGGGVCCVN